MVCYLMKISLIVIRRIDRMETNDKQISEFLKVVNEQIDNFEETVDEKALDEACNIILEAEKK